MRNINTLLVLRRSFSTSCCRLINENFFRGRKVNYDLNYLRNQSKDNLAYRVVRLQRVVDSYHSIYDPTQFDGRDKIRVDHPSTDEIITERTLLRKVAFKVLYVGWEYQNFEWKHSSASFQSTQGTNSVERVFLEALLRQQIIPGPKCNLDRAGRTDQHVSGVGQVINAVVRSKVKDGYGVWNEDEDVDYENQLSISDTSKDQGEIPYVKLLNEALPLDIRVLAWSPVRKTFSARYQCKSRLYKYMFLKGKADIDLMNESAKKFVGHHDFKHFCKTHSQNLFKHRIRDLISFKVKVITSNHDNPEYDVCVAEIEGQSFTYKQIRCMTSILLKVGMKDIPPSVIDEMLDVKNTLKKPDYGTLKAENLLFHDVTYEEDDVSWRWDEDALMLAADSLTQRLTDHSAKSEVLKQMLNDVTSRVTSQDNKAELGSMLYHGMYKNGIVHFGVNEETNSIEEKQEKGKQRSISTRINKGFYGSAKLIADNMKERLKADSDVKKNCFC